MKLIVNPHTIEIKKDLVNEKEIDITKCEFEFADEITNDYVKEAYFTFNGTSYKQIIANNECKIPNEVLQEKGQIEIGVVAYLVENEEEIKRYNPSPAYFSTLSGSLKDAENSEPITPSEMEQFEQILEDGLNEVANVNIDANQTSQGGTITITDRDGISKTIYVYNGEKGETGEQGPVGPKGDTGEQGIQGEKGDKGDKGEQGIPGKDGLNGQDGKDGKDGKDGVDGQDGYTPIKGVDYFTPEDIASLNIPEKTSDLINDSGFITNSVDNLLNYYKKSETFTKQEVNDLISAITTMDLQVVQTLPTEDISTTTIYLVPKNPAETNNAYDEYIYVSNAWEFIGSTEVDLTDYVKNTDYANPNIGGVVRANGVFGVEVASSGSYKGCLYARTANYSNYLNVGNDYFISKGTLENVITGKQLVNQTYVDSLVGDIGTALDEINGEVVD